MKTAQIEPKALLVARVSDVEQRKALPAQKKRLYEYAKRCRWAERQDFRYVEFDETAFKENRVTFKQLVIQPLQAMATHSIVVFDKIDRFSRDSTSDERAALTKLFRQGKIGVRLLVECGQQLACTFSDRFMSTIGVSGQLAHKIWQ